VKGCGGCSEAESDGAGGVEEASKGGNGGGVRLSEGRGQNNQQPTPNDNKKRVVVFLCGSGR